ncbi:MAG: T9SS type A sorting domain-containing protein [Salibacteraceae bacterium]
MLLLVIMASAFIGRAQINSSVSSQDASCSYNNDGSISIDSIIGCFAPIEIQVDSNTYTINHLKNDEYILMNHGAGPGTDQSYSVWAGQGPNGPVYIATGTFANSVTFDTTSFTAASPQEMFTVCYDANTSQVLWAISGSTPGNNYTSGYAVTGDGNNAFVTGYFTGTCQMGNTSITSTGGYQAFIAKIDIATGLVDTITQYGDANDQEGFNIHYAAGRIYLGGNFAGGISIAGNNFTSAGGFDAFVLCLDTNMSTEYWSAAAGGTGAEILNDLVAQVDNGVTQKVFVTGEFAGTANFGSNSVTSAGAEDFFIAALDTNGNWIWTESGGSSNADFCTTIDINTDGDRLYLGGSWSGNMTFGGQNFTAVNSDDGFIAYMDTAGVLDSLYVLSGSAIDFVIDLQSIDDDFLVFTAQFSGSLTYADSTYASNGARDAFIGKIGKDFHEIWGKNFGATNDDLFSSIRLGPNDHVHASGFFSADASAYQNGLISAGGRDVVVTNDLIAGMADTSINITGLSAGNYLIHYTDSNGNTMADTIILGPDSIITTGTVINATSGTANDGSISLNVSGGVPGYTYQWSNGAVTQNIDSLVAGQYCVTVTDTTGCMDSTCFVVDSVSAGGALVVVGMITHLNCFGDSSGSIDLTVNGGVPPYSFQWSNGATTEDLTSIAAGTYVVTVNDNDTNVYIDSFNVTQPDEIIVSASITPPSSGIADDGAIDQTVNGGIAPYTYSWNNGETSQDLDSLTIGVYSVTITDSSGCFVTKTYDVDTIPALSLVSISSGVTCLNTDNGMIDLTVIGGSSPFSFLWSNGQTSEDVSGLAAGVYTVTVTDSVGQIAILSDTIGSNPIHPDPIVGPISGPQSVQAWTNYNYDVPATNGSAFDWAINGGSLVAAASNAATLQWNAGPKGMIFVTETDANGCIGLDSLEVDILFVGIDQTNENAIAVFPNPAIHQLNIFLPTKHELPTITLTDLTGKTLYQRRAETYQLSIEMTDFPSGAYILNVAYPSKGLRLHHTVIKQ